MLAIVAPMTPTLYDTKHTHKKRHLTRCEIYSIRFAGKNCVKNVDGDDDDEEEKHPLQHIQ